MRGSGVGLGLEESGEGEKNQGENAQSNCSSKN